MGCSSFRSQEFRILYIILVWRDVAVICVCVPLCHEVHDLHSKIKIRLERLTCPCRVCRPTIWPSSQGFAFSLGGCARVSGGASENRPPPVPARRASFRNPEFNRAPPAATTGIKGRHTSLLRHFFRSLASSFQTCFPVLVDGSHRPVTAFAPFSRSQCLKNAGPRRTCRMLLRELQ